MAWSDAAREAAAEARKGTHSSKINDVPTMGSHELKVFADNDSGLYHSSMQPIQANLDKKMVKGTYDHGLATKLWGYHADRAAQSYAKQFGGPGANGKKMFSPNDRRAAAKSWADEYRDSRSGVKGTMA